VGVQQLVTLRGWEGNRRSGITLTMHDKLQWHNHLQA